jgi:Chromo (CHRromatin Organisation MOdifier) domain
MSTDITIPAVYRFTAEMQQALAKAKRCLEAAQQRQKAYADKHRSPVKIKVGDMVLLSGKNIELKHPGSRKLLPKWLGPFKVTAKVNPMAFALELPPTMRRLHHVFHTSLLAPYHSSGAVKPPPPVLLEDGNEEYEVEQILDHKVVSRRKQRKTDYLIKWSGYSHEHNSWEPEENMTNCNELLQEYHSKLANKLHGTVPGRRRGKKRKASS